MMKKILFTLIFGLGIGAVLQAQSLTVTVRDSGVATAGVAVFLYDSTSDFQQSWTQYDPDNYVAWTYTNSSGQAVFNLSPAQYNDSLFFATFDCGQNLAFGSNMASPARPNIQGTLNLTCLPNICDAFIVESMDSTGLFNGSAVGLLDTNYHSGQPGNYIYKWTLGNTVLTGSQVQNQFTAGSNPTTYCFELFQGCTSVCDSITGAPANSGSNLTCSPYFFVDTVNSGNFQGQLIVGEASTISSGSIVSYQWDFGDGTTINGQYVSHTYATTYGVYNVCLTITGVDGADTCVSTYCDSIGFDSTGAVVFKQGFTINVIDPATFSAEERILAETDLFPNPSAGRATLEWDPTLEMERVDIFRSNGQHVESIQPSDYKLNLQGYKAGAYIIRLQTQSGAATRQWIVQ